MKRKLAFNRLYGLFANTVTCVCKDVKTCLQRCVEISTPTQKYPFLLLLLPLLVVPASAQMNVPVPDPPGLSFEIPTRQYLLGDWGGERSALAEKGITFDFFYISDLQINTAGDKDQTKAGWERIRGTVDINFDQFMEWKGLRFHATGLWQGGANLGAKIGTIANPSSLVSAHATRLDSWWLEQLFLNNKMRIRVGQLAGLDFYGNQTYGSSYLIEPLGYAFGNLFSATYEPYNPAGTPGVEIRFAPTRSFYFKTAAMAGNRDQYNQDPTGFGFKILDTPVFLFETGYLVDPPGGASGNSRASASGKSYPGVYRFGAAYNDGKIPDATGTMSKGNYLIYSMASQALFRSAAGSNRGLDATFGFDWSPGDVTRQNFQITAGTRFNAPFEGREKDGIAFGFVYSRISDPYRRFSALLGEPPLGSEKAFELNYSFQVTPYFLLQPTFQYYVDVGANPALRNAPIFGLRTKLEL
jgi:porin